MVTPLDFKHWLQRYILNKQYHVKALLKRFYLNGKTIEFHPLTQKLELHTKQIAPCESTAEEVSFSWSTPKDFNHRFKTSCEKQRCRNLVKERFQFSQRDYGTRLVIRKIVSEHQPDSTNPCNSIQAILQFNQAIFSFISKDQICMVQKPCI